MRIIAHKMDWAHIFTPQFGSGHKEWFLSMIFLAFKEDKGNKHDKHDKQESKVLLRNPFCRSLKVTQGDWQSSMLCV